MARETSRGVAGFCVLPEDCLAKILSLTTISEACTLSCVSKDVGSAADSDAVWEKFLPSDYRDIVNRSINPSSILALRSKKIYRRLCDRPLLIDGGRKTFSMVKRNGKKCYMLAAKDLEIAWGHKSLYWKWGPLPESRFRDVAMLNFVWHFQIRGRISTLMLSLDTMYAAYLVFRIMAETIGLKDNKMEVSFGIVGDAIETQLVYLDTEGHYGWDRQYAQYTRCRDDGWLEVKLGEFFNEKEAERQLEMSLQEIKSETMKKGVIVEGIEIRPKHKGPLNSQFRSILWKKRTSEVCTRPKN